MWLRLSIGCNESNWKYLNKIITITCISEKRSRSGFLKEATWRRFWWCPSPIWSLCKGIYNILTDWMLLNVSKGGGFQPEFGFSSRLRNIPLTAKQKRSVFHWFRSDTEWTLLIRFLYSTWFFSPLKRRKNRWIERILVGINCRPGTGFGIFAENGRNGRRIFTWWSQPFYLGVFNWRTVYSLTENALPSII